MKFERAWTGNWENAFRGLRHPMESYAKSDSLFGILPVDWLDEPFNETLKKYKDTWYDYHNYDYGEPYDEIKVFNWLDENYTVNYYPKGEVYEFALIGPADLNLAQRMIKAGTPNDKFLRQIFVSVDITAPLYWWKEMDTYKVGTTANSTSTMHKLASTPITIDCFEIDDWNKDFDNIIPDDLIPQLEDLRQKYLETKDKRYWKELVRWLPESWLQTRTWTADYAVLRNIYKWRKNHKLSEWRQFCDFIKTLPYANELIVFENE